MGAPCTYAEVSLHSAGEEENAKAKVDYVMQAHAR